MLVFCILSASSAENARGHKGSPLLRLHPISPSSGGGVGEGIWRLSTCHSLHAVWSGVPRALMLLPTLHLLLGQLRSDMFHINRMFGHYLIGITTNNSSLCRRSCILITKQTNHSIQCSHHNKILPVYWYHSNLKFVDMVFSPSSAHPDSS